MITERMIYEELLFRNYSIIIIKNDEWENDIWENIIKKLVSYY